MYLTNYIFSYTFFHIASYQIFKNSAILINYGSFFQKKNFIQLNCFQFLKMNQLLSNLVNFLINILFRKIVFQ